MFKFHLIWCSIAQESRLRRMRRILGENYFSRYLPADNIRSYQTISDLQFEFTETSNWTISDSTRKCPNDSFSPTFIHCFGCILITECSFNLILLPLAS
jgi:hypothetical protein